MALPGRMTRASLLAMLVRGFADEVAFRRRVAAYVAALVERASIQLVETADSPAEMVLFEPRRHPSVPFVVRLHGPTSVWERFDRNVPELFRRAMATLKRRQCLRAAYLTCPSEAVAASHPTAKLMPIGPDYPTPEPFDSTVAYLRHLIRTGLTDRVTFEGYCPHERLGEYFRRAAVCVAPSLFEVVGYACLEAISHGEAIVAGDRSGMVDLLDEGRCGLLFTPHLRSTSRS